MSLYDDASLIMYPSGYKEDKIYSLKPTDGSGDLTFSRASSATRVNAEGLIEEVPYNLLQQSNSFDTTWATTRASLTSGESGYDGSNNAWAMVDTTDNNTHLTVQSLTLGAEQATFSAYAKAGAVDFIVFRFEGDTGVDYAYFNLSNGTLGTIDSNYTDATITSVGNGWYRCSVTRTLGASGNQAIILSAQSDNDPTYAGAGTTAIYIQDAQLNSGSTAKTYFTTTDRLNVPRIDYTGGGCGKLLLEPQRTNKLTTSSDFSSYLKSGTITTTANYGESPSGQTDSTRVVFSSASNALYKLSVHSGNTEANTIYVKGTSGETIKFGKGVTVNGGSIFTLNGDWQRLEYVSTSGNQFTINTYSSATAREIEIWGAQLEAGSYATSYIPTSGATVTRLADTANGAGDVSTFNDSEGVLFFEGSVLDFSTTNSWISISENSNVHANQFNLRFVENTNLIQAVSRAGGLGQDVVLQHTLNDKTTINKIAIKYKLNDWALWVNGVEVDTESSSNAFTPNSLDVLDFHRGNNSNFFYGNVQNLMVFPSALTDDELETLTTL